MTPLDIRAFKINLPWESYRRHASLQLHETACRDLDFWRALIDHLAWAGFNRLSLWSLHPWALMVRPAKYPEACDLTDEELAEWQAFWHALFGHVHERGLKVQIFTWNIFVSPAFARARNVAAYSIGGDYLGDGDLSDLVEDYTREIVTEALQTFPEIDGLGLTLSERMGGLDNPERGEWVKRTYGAAASAAGRPLEINLRVPHSGSGHCNAPLTDETLSVGRRLLEESGFDGPLLSEVKFNWSHGHSSPRLLKIHNGAPNDALWNPPPSRYRITWMVRNEDFQALRWCAPGFIREHLRLNTHPWVAGYYTGSETWIPALNLVDRDDHPHRAAWQFQRQRLFTAVWGHLLRDPDATDEDLGRMVEEAYDLPEHQSGAGLQLLRALECAGTIPLRIASFLNFTWDHTLYVEGMLTLDGFITVEQVQKARPLEPDWLGVADAVAAERSGTHPPGRLHPEDLAKELEDLASETEQRLRASLVMSLEGPVVEEREDARVWAALGRYFAEKLRAALALEREGKDSHQAQHHLRNGLTHWQRVVELTESRYQPFPVQHLDKTEKVLWHWKDWMPLVSAECGVRKADPTTSNK